jgi:hypothetical protein
MAISQSSRLGAFWLLSVGRGGPRGAAPVPPVLVSAAPGRVGLIAGGPRLVTAPGSPPGFQSLLREKIRRLTMGGGSEYNLPGLQSRANCIRIQAQPF